MITSQKDYEKALAKIQAEHNFPIVASFIYTFDGFKDGEKDPFSVYSIDLNTRQITIKQKQFILKLIVTLSILIYLIWFL